MQLTEIVDALESAKKNYVEEYRNRLVEILKEIGMYNVDVVATKTDTQTVGQFRIEPLYNMEPFPCLCFHRYNKQGILSNTLRYSVVSPWQNNTDEIIKKNLQSCYAPVERSRQEQEINNSCAEQENEENVLEL